MCYNRTQNNILKLQENGEKEAFMTYIFVCRDSGDVIFIHSAQTLEHAFEIFESTYPDKDFVSVYKGERVK